MKIGDDGGFIRGGVVVGGIRVGIGSGGRIGIERSADALLGIGGGLGGGSGGVCKSLALLLLLLGSGIKGRVNGR